LLVPSDRRPAQGNCLTGAIMVCYIVAGGSRLPLRRYLRAGRAGWIAGEHMAPPVRDMISGFRSMLGIISSRLVLAGPRSVALAIADVCNTKCIMCWCHSPLTAPARKQTGASPGAAYMDPALFETILREARQMGTYRVVLGGNGEPTLHPQFDRMLELMDRLEIVPYVLTNGIGIDEPRLRVWATKRAHFRFSMHAGDVETWLRVHTVGTEGQFQQLCRTIRALVAAGTPHISTMHVIHKQNYRHVRRMVEHARELGVKDVLFRPVRATGLLADVVLDPEQETRLRHELTQCLKLAERYHIRTNLREVLDHNLYIRSGVLDTRHLYRRIPCYIGWIYAEFDIEGAMTPCLDSRIVMGHAGRDRLRDMWTSPRYWTFRRHARRMPIRGQCVPGCVCHACCMTKFNVNIYNLLRLRSFRYGEA
jgi:MoaA/NifB/PqqE/SkfB family radical SAM enzyme